MLKTYAAENKLGSVPFDEVNGWTLEQYRHLWDLYADRLERLYYREVHTATGRELIERYPSCFRAKTDRFDSVTVSNIETVFRKRN